MGVLRGDLDEDQRRVYDHVIDQIREGPPEQRYHYITGFPGTGKSFLTRALIEDLATDHTVVTLSWYGIAARSLRVSAKTIMSYFGLTFAKSGIVGDNSYLRSVDITQAKMIESLREHGSGDIQRPKLVMILDEVEALHDTILDAMACAVREIRLSTSSHTSFNLCCREDPFGDAAIVMIGDPCQIGRIPLTSNSPEYPPSIYPTKEFWHARAWGQMQPTVYYLRNFHRGCDEDYLNLLSEIISAPRIEPSKPHFSSRSMKILQSIRDRDGGKQPPRASIDVLIIRFDHVVVCLTNAEVDKRNNQYLKLIPGEAYEFDAIDTEGSTCSYDIFDYKAVTKLGYKDKVVLKEGCRVMATVNSSARSERESFTNGLMGKVIRIYRDLAGQPTVVVKFDDQDHNVRVRRETLTVYRRDGSIRFQRQQIPLAVAHAATAHKLIGSSLPGVWLHLPAIHGRQDETIRQYWDSPWLEGLIYTALSRVGSRERIRVYPLRNTTDPGLVHPIFLMNPEALRFDDACAEQDWLRSLEREPDPAVDTSTSEARRENHCGVSQAEVDAHIDKVMRELKACKSKMMLLHHYTTKRRTTPSGDPINPVFFCMQNPSLEEKIDGLSVETQIKFYDSLDEKLNLTHPRPSRDHLQSYMRDFASAAIAGAIPSRVPCEDPDVATAVVSDIENQQGTPEEGWLSGEDHSQMTSHNREHSPGDPSVAPDQQDSSYDETSADDDDDDDDDYSTENPIEIPVQPDDPPADEPEFADEPFTVYEGNMFEVLSVYLKEKPHYRLVSSTLEELRGARKTCYLECRRSISSRNERLEPKKGSKPDWRLWPTFTCPLKRVKVSFREGRCMFYPLRLVGATAEEWRNHEHYPGTESCRSATIPPDVVDDWIVALSSRPCSTNGELKKMAMQKNISGGYCAQTTEFLTQRGLGNYEAVRAVIRSIKESKDCGLSVTAFTRSLMEMACGADMLRGEVSEIIGGLDALERGTHSSIELNLARKADCCLVLEDILCESQPGVDDLTVMSLRSYSAVITSPRMLRNLRGCYTMGIDATFNLTHADLKLGVICSLPKTSTAQPIAIVIMTQESTECIEHALKQLTDAAAHLKMLGGVPREVVLDGSAAIHAAVMSHYGGAEESQPHCISCYFHVLKRAKDCKAKVRLSTSLWLEIKKDLALLGEAHSREDWLRLRELFMKKWTEERNLELSDAEAVRLFLVEFAGYLEPSSWRSRWYRNCSEVCGPRTNNGVERFNKELKKSLLPSRSRLSLNEFVTFLRSDGDWAVVSQYGRENVRGQPNEKMQTEAVQYSTREKFSEVPQSWVPATVGLNGDKVTLPRWLFPKSPKDQLVAKNMREHLEGPSGADAKKLVDGSYASLSEAYALRRTYCIVGCHSMAGSSGDQANTLWCTCSLWGRELCCGHTVCLSHHLEESDADLIWKAAGCRFKRPKQRRNNRGQFDDSTLPFNARHGLNPKQHQKRGAGASSLEKARKESNAAMDSNYDAHPQDMPMDETARTVRSSNTVETDTALHEPLLPVGEKIATASSEHDMLPIPLTDTKQKEYACSQGCQELASLSREADLSRTSKIHHGSDS